MPDDRHTIRGDLDIKLNEGGTVRNSTTERGQRVLSCFRHHLARVTDEVLAIPAVHIESQRQWVGSSNKAINGKCSVFSLEEQVMLTLGDHRQLYTPKRYQPAFQIFEPVAEER